VCDGLNPLVYSSPIYGDGVIVAMVGFKAHWWQSSPEEPET